ncbi:5161_t:CDS:2 [Rhizophagus irregularis]|nr:5161_t:CDS:2 [Rhizophagus irregularis]
MELKQQLQQFYDNKHVTYNPLPLSPLDEVAHNHSAVTPSPLSLPGLFLSRNRSRISTPKIENLPKIPSAYTAQVQQSDSPLRTEFRNSDLDGSDSDSSKQNNVKNMLGEILNKDRLSNFKERTPVKNTNESLVRFDFRNASVSPISNTSITPIIQKPNENENEKQKHDVIKIGPNVEIKVYKPNQGSILMLIAVFVLATIVFITWKLGDWGIGNAQNIYDVTTNNGFLSMNPSGT